MFDCSKDVRAFHDQQVVLSQAEQRAMRERRDANRKRLRKGLEANGDPAPIEFVKQGSYAMKTMLQHPKNDYDIDDGAYFEKDDLCGDRGGEMSALDARWMVRDALDDGSFKDPPEVRPNCVRVFYAGGYHVDVPVYRRSGEEGSYIYDLASSTGWRRSDARDVTDWFEDELVATGQTYLVRRLVRYVKKFAKSRSSWGGRILSGFGITVLVIERRHLDNFREDRAVYETMKAVRDRLDWNLVVAHPVTPGETITTGTADAKATFLRSKLSDAIGWLVPLFETDCTREQALECWDKVYNTDFFSARYKEEQASASAVGVGLKAAIGSGALIGLEQATAASVLGAGGGRHA